MVVYQSIFKVHHLRSSMTSGLRTLYVFKKKNIYIFDINQIYIKPIFLISCCPNDYVYSCNWVYSYLDANNYLFVTLTYFDIMSYFWSNDLIWQFGVYSKWHWLICHSGDTSWPKQSKIEMHIQSIWNLHIENRIFSCIETYLTPI